MRLLVTGTGRCGTQWIATAITAAGVPCTHEVSFTATRHGDGNWQAEASWPAAPYTPVPDTHLVHLLRHPLAVIRSRAAGGLFADPPARRLRRLARFTYRHAPTIADGTNQVERSALHWVAWNALVTNPDELLALERVTAGDITRLARVVDPHAPGLDTLPPPHGGRARLGPPVTWAQVAHVPGLLEAAERYG